MWLITKYKCDENGKPYGYATFSSSSFSPDRDYKLKFRSSKYQNLDMRLEADGTLIQTYTTNGGDARNAYVYNETNKNYDFVAYLPMRTKHWSDEYNAEEHNMLQRFHS